MSGQYRIEKWSLPVRVGGVEVGRHHFLVLKDGNGKTVRELHGGAEEIGLDGQSTGNLKLTALSGTLLVKEGDVSKGIGKETYSSNPIASDMNRPRFVGCSNFQIGWSHDEQNDEQVFTRGARACREIGDGSRGRLPLALGGLPVDFRQDWLLGAYAA